MASTAGPAEIDDEDAVLLGLIRQILAAASKHDLAELRRLIRSQENEALVPKGSNLANLKDPQTGTTALHAAIASDRQDESTASGGGGDHRDDDNSGEGRQKDGEADEKNEEEAERWEEEVLVTVQWLLGEGAIWNDLNGKDETPGCVARKLGLEKVYRELVDAGVRAELLMGRLEGYEPLTEEEDGEAEEEQDEEKGDEAHEAHQDASQPSDMNNEYAVATDGAEGKATSETVDSGTYLDSTLTFTPHRLLDASSNGVMMSWETDIMRRSVSSLIPPTPPEQPLRILNIGHGMGIIDNFFQSSRPVEHHIVEAHPAVLQHMRDTGWHEKPGVTVHAGKWQEVLPSLVSAGTTFDVIYYDTFAESYSDFREFFSEYVVALLNPQGGRWSFFNGMGADRQIAYDVYQKVVEIDLLENGFDVEWEEIDVPDLSEKGEWEGVKRAYWAIEKYRLPVCKFAD